MNKYDLAINDYVYDLDIDDRTYLLRNLIQFLHTHDYIEINHNGIPVWEGDGEHLI